MRGRAAKGVVAILSAGSMTIMIGCSSSGGSNASSTTASNSGDTSQSSSAAGGGSQATLLAKANSEVASWSDLSKVNLPKPTQSFNPGKHKVMVLEAGAGGGALRIGSATNDAFKAMGWDATVYDGKFTPAEQSKGIQQAVQQGYDAIVLDAVDTSALKSDVTAALAKKIKIVCVQCGATPGFNQIVNVTTTGLKDGDGMSWYIIQQTQGKANVLMVEDKAFIITQNRVKSLQQNLTSRCPQCTFKKIEMATADLATPGPPVLTAALQTDKNVNWVAAPYDASVPTMAKTVQQLSPHSGLNGWDGDPPAVQLIGQSTVVKAVMSAPYEYLSWAAADQAARMVNGKATWKSDDMPERLCTKDNWTQFKSGNWTPPGFDFKAYFKKLWTAG